MKNCDQKKRIKNNFFIFQPVKLKIPQKKTGLQGILIFSLYFSKALSSKVFKFKPI